MKDGAKQDVYADGRTFITYPDGRRTPGPPLEITVVRAYVDEAIGIANEALAPTNYPSLSAFDIMLTEQGRYQHFVRSATNLKTRRIGLGVKMMTPVTRQQYVQRLARTLVHEVTHQTHATRGDSGAHLLGVIAEMTLFTKDVVESDPLYNDLRSLDVGNWKSWPIDEPPPTSLQLASFWLIEASLRGDAPWPGRVE